MQIFQSNGFETFADIALSSCRAEKGKEPRGLTQFTFGKLDERRRWSTLHRNPPPPQLVYPSDNSWTTPSISQ
jgi:hypothetical protein